MIELPPLTKRYYTIGEVAEMFSISTSMIRFWEKEFKELKPAKSSRGDRKFTEKDIIAVGKIYTLLKEDGFTIDGAKKAIIENTNITLDNKDLLVSKLKILKKSLIDLKKELQDKK